MNLNSTLIIAEAGVNHNGSMEDAKKLVDVASHSGADMIKFQTFSAEQLVTKKAKKAKYANSTTDAGESQYDMIKKLELNRMMHEELIEYCKQCKIEFFSTGFDLKSIDLLVDLGLERFKIPSGEINNLPYLRHIGRYGKPIILSTGMANLQEISDAIEVIVKSGTAQEKITVLHCNTEYPTPMSDVNLEAMCSIRDSLNVQVGYSDHTLGIEVPVAAVALGAKIIEKHFTLNRNLPGPDHSASLEPNELKDMVIAIRNIEQALGDGIKRPSKSEKKNIPTIRKSIVAKNIIKKGEFFSEKNLTVKRPGTGISPMEWDNLIGHKSVTDFEPDDLIKL